MGVFYGNAAVASGGQTNATRPTPARAGRAAQASAGDRSHLAPRQALAPSCVAAAPVHLEAACEGSRLLLLACHVILDRVVVLIGPRDRARA